MAAGAPNDGLHRTPPPTRHLAGVKRSLARHPTRMRRRRGGFEMQWQANSRQPCPGPVHQRRSFMRRVYYFSLRCTVCGLCRDSHSVKPSPRRCRAARLVEELFCQRDRYGASQQPTWGCWHSRLIKQASEAIQVALRMWRRGHSGRPSFGLLLLDSRCAGRFWRPSLVEPRARGRPDITTMGETPSKLGASRTMCSV